VDGETDRGGNLNIDSSTLSVGAGTFVSGFHDTVNGQYDYAGKSIPIGGAIPIGAIGKDFSTAGDWLGGTWGQ